MNVSELKKKLKSKTQKELIDDISTLYKSFDVVREYYQVRLFSNDESVLQKYKAIIEHEFFPVSESKDPPARLSVARKAITDYKKLTSSKANIADIMVFYVETGVRFTNEYGDINEAFYISMENMYEKALTFIANNGLTDIFNERLLTIVNDTDGIGWGFHDQLADLYFSYIE
ncbi:MAG: DUF6155 family protein [Desulfobacteraceae bacterium]|jgi:hypothetical protein